MPVLALNTEKAANVVETFVPLYRDKDITLYTGDFQSKYGHVFSQFLTPMFISDQLLFINNWMCIALELRNMESDFGILPPAKYDDSQDRYYVPSSESWMYYAVVPVTEPDLPFTGHVMDALGYFGKKEVHTAIIEKTITDKTARDTDTEEMMHIIYDNRCFDLGSLFDWGGVTGMLNSFIGSKSTNFASAMASKEKAIVSAIEKTVADFTE